MDAAYLVRAARRLDAKTTRGRRCWLWTGAVTNSGYGLLYFDGRITGAHRVAWVLQHGPVPEGLVVAHSCDVKLCVNPKHLFLATQAENLADMRSKGRHASGSFLGAAISAGWTPEKRQRQSEVHTANGKRRREEAAVAAGHPSDWRRCPVCSTWKPPDDFGPNPARPEGRENLCRPCKRDQIRDTVRRRRARLR